MAVFSYDSASGLTNFSSGFEERNIHSYTEDSAIYIVDEDFGSITAGVDAEEDYGSILDTNLTGWQVVDYGSITINQTIVPYGPINVGDNDFGEIKLIKVGIGDVTFSILGEATIFTTPIEKGSGTLTIRGTSGDPRFSLAHFGSGSLFTLESGTEVKGSNPPEEILLFRISGIGAESFTPATHIGSGSLFTFISKTEAVASTEQAQGLFKISGSAVPIVSLSHFGSGRLFAFTGSSESITADPQESTALFKIVGENEYRFIENNVIISEGSLLLRGISENRSSKSYDADVLINLEGAATESVTPAPHIGSGRLFAFTGSSESIAADPQESTALFRFSGAATESASDIHVGSGLVNLDGSAKTIFELKHIASGQLQIEGVGAESVTPAPHIGSGRLFAFTGSSESISSNPPESTALFRFNGVAVDRFTSAYDGKVKIDVEGSATTIFRLLHVGSGSLFTFSSTTEAVVVNPPESTALFRINGVAAEKRTKTHIGSGSLFTFISSTETETNAERSRGLFKVSGTSKNLFVINNIGTGSLFAFSSTTEAFAVNPKEETALFRFAGVGAEKRTKTYIGSGSLFTFVSATESETNAERSAGLFKISGSAKDLFVLNNIGSGSLFAFSSTTEAIVVNPPDQTTLFTFSGSAVEKNTEAYLGTGSLFTFVSATESVGANPPETTAVFRFTGTAAESVTPAPHIGSGKLFAFGSSAETSTVSETASGVFTFTGSVVQRKTNAFAGFGSLFTFTSTTEAISISPVSVVPLFKIAGTVAESFVPAPHIGSGSLFTFISATESTLVSPGASGLFRFVGNTVEVTTKSQLGSGSLFAITGSYEAINVIPQITGVLFTLFGFVRESYTPAPEIGTGIVNLEGLSENRRIEFVPAKPTRILII